VRASVATSAVGFTARVTSTPTAAARFNFDQFAAKQVAVESAAGPAATLAAFRAAEPRQTAPPGPKETWLVEAFVHGEDIRSHWASPTPIRCRK
jgi:hypothetical protein